MDIKNVKVLLAEDDPNLGSLLKEYLEAKGYLATLCINGEEAYQKYRKENFDICVLDIMMPVKDGYTLAKEIRKADPRIPIIFLTAKSLKQDAIEGFNAGADDYITKPFSMEELLVRMKAILRRTLLTEKESADRDHFQIGKFQFTFNTQLLKMGDQQQKLTSKEAELLRMLCWNMNNVVDRSDALKMIWEDDSYFNARSMDVYITKLRKYLKEDPSVELVNVHGKGFKLMTPAD
ncbi:MAG: response regulator transcription factor [Bacteroidota bacterium]